MARVLVLLPLGTAAVERSFSTLNRILNSTRCRLDTEHVKQLMMLSVEGIAIPDVRNDKDDEKETMSKFLDDAFNVWLKKPHRLMEEI
jgi:hAT family C-terminal dimerisation region